jgi:hypothetical protein
VPLTLPSGGRRETYICEKVNSNNNNNNSNKVVSQQYTGQSKVSIKIQGSEHCACMLLSKHMRRKTKLSDNICISIKIERIHEK